MTTGRDYHGTTRYYGNSRTYQQGRYESRVTGGRERYVHGSAAHQLETAPERRQAPKRKTHTRPRPSQRPVDLPSISGRSFVFLATAIVVVLIFAFQYLCVRSGITQMQNEAVVLQNEIAETKIENEEAYRKISDSVDLSKVYDIAVGKLGMTQAMDNQVYTYDNKKSDMVKQYGDIPEASK